MVLCGVLMLAAAPQPEPTPWYLQPVHRPDVPRATPAANRPLQGKCTAQLILTLLQKLAPPSLFRQFVYENGVRFYKVA